MTTGEGMTTFEDRNAWGSAVGCGKLDDERSTSHPLQDWQGEKTDGREKDEREKRVDGGRVCV
jgi:hypothetical protein